MKGCIYYAFAQDLTDPNLFHLTEGWADEAAYEAHEEADTFLTALSTVVKNVRILDRQGVRYEVGRIVLDDPRGRVASCRVSIGRAMPMPLAYPLASGNLLAWLVSTYLPGTFAKELFSFFICTAKLKIKPKLKLKFFIYLYR